MSVSCWESPIDPCKTAPSRKVQSDYARLSASHVLHRNWLGAKTAIAAAAAQCNQQTAQAFKLDTILENKAGKLNIQWSEYSKNSMQRAAEHSSNHLCKLRYDQEALPGTGSQVLRVKL